jgi:hypothetical protein
LPAEGEKLTIYARTKLDTSWSILVQKTFTIADEPSLSVNNSKVSQNNLYSYPNPMHNSTNIKYTLSQPSYVSLKVYNAIGEYIATIEEGDMQQGEHIAEWNSGNKPPGIYFCIFNNFSSINRDEIAIVKQ